MNYKNIFLCFSAALIFISCTKEKPGGELPTEQKPTHSGSAALFKPDNVMSQSFTINAEDDFIIKGKKGTRVFIAKNTFEDLNGQPVKGQITIELKEVLDTPEMVLANLFTTSDGNMLESGGMIYINATQNNANLKVNDAKAIQIAVPTSNKKKMLLFEGIANAENSVDWKNPKDVIGPSNNKSQPINNNQTVPNEFDLGQEPKPVKPEKYSAEDDDLISVEFADASLFPEFDIYKDVKFKLLDPSAYKPEDTKREWAAATLKKTATDGVYTIIFSDRDIKKTFLVKPMFTGSDYTKALAEYNDKIEKYEANQKKIEKEQWETWSKASKKSRTAGKLEFNSDPATNYIFSTNRLGWYNIDRLYMDPAAQEIEFYASVIDRTEFEAVNVAMVYKAQNIYYPAWQNTGHYYSFSADPSKPIRLPLGAKVSLLATAYKNGAPYFFIKNIVISPSQTIEVTLKKTTIEDLKTALFEKV